MIHEDSVCDAQSLDLKLIVYIGIFVSLSTLRI